MEKSKEIIRRYIGSYETGNMETLNAFLHPSHVYYPPGGGKPMSLKDRINSEKFFFSAFSGIKAMVEDQVAEGDTVASRISMHCTHTGDFHGVPATNKRIVITYMDISLLKDGKIFKEWAEFDTMNILNQLQ